MKKLAVLEQEIYADAGETFNINSPKQLGVILFEKTGHAKRKETQKRLFHGGRYSGKRWHRSIRWFRKLLDYRQMTKLKSTYADGLAGYIQEDGRIHGTFNQTITATGRISSTEPNLQNIPIRMELG